MLEWYDPGIPTLYPENLTKLQQIYDKTTAKDIILSVREFFKWMQGNSLIADFAHDGEVLYAV